MQVPAVLVACRWSSNGRARRPRRPDRWDGPAEPTPISDGGGPCLGSSGSSPPSSMGRKRCGQCRTALNRRGQNTPTGVDHAVWRPAVRGPLILAGGERAECGSGSCPSLSAPNPNDRRDRVMTTRWRTRRAVRTDRLATKGPPAVAVPNRVSHTHCEKELKEPGGTGDRNQVGPLGTKGPAGTCPTREKPARGEAGSADGGLPRSRR